MSKFRAIFLAVTACGLAGFASAETLQMGGTENASRFEHAGKPSRGMTQARVEAEYGQPASRQAAVGEPPITRWEYADFVVFFEYDRVIHAVTKR
jgi:hypothetical protein